MERGGRISNRVPTDMKTSSLAKSVAHRTRLSRSEVGPWIRGGKGEREFELLVQYMSATADDYFCREFLRPL
jgi:hypothetical protein